MKFRYAVLTSMSLFFLSACSEKPVANGAEIEPETERDPVSETQKESPSAAPALVDRGNVDFVEIPLDGSSNKFHAISIGKSISGEFASPKAGVVVGVEVQVGNYANSSIGMLNLNICQAKTCVDGSADLANSKDNEYFYVPLKAPLQLAGAGDAVTYTFTRESGENNFALWSYPASASTSMLTLSDGKAEPRTLKLGLRYSR